MSESANPDPTRLQGVVDDLRQNDGDQIAVVLIGSAARGVWAEGSDIDLLVIGNVRPEIVRHLSGYHIHTSAEAEFLQNLESGEDFEAWAVRFGTPLFDSGIWARIKGSPSVATWPRWQVKVVHGARRLFLADSLSEIGDMVAATEETLFALGHIARAILLRAEVFPLSRPELAKQVRNAGYPHLADMHEQLRQAVKVPFRTLGRAQRYTKKLLCHLDPATYRACSQDYRASKKAREKRRALRGGV